MSSAPTTITITVNGKTYTPVIPEGRYTLLDLLRDLGLNGAKFGCGVGKCGSCTVVMDGKAVASCTIMASKADGASVTTIEGISDGYSLHPIQEAFVDNGAIQCGYCTPGFIMRLYGLFTAKPDASEAEIAEELEKNICRCTGYETIVAAAKDAQTRMKG
jgi:aerobic carbon-monoxide dehydrogenase small subunit